MSEVLVGVDVGGTKTHVAVADENRVVADSVLPSIGWNPRPWEAGAAWLVDVLDRVHASWRDAVSVVVGAHGCDSPEQSAALQAALSRAAGRPCLVHNDAELVLPSAGLTEGVAIIAGTGSIASGHRAGAPAITVGGWGWLLGDEGSAPSLVRAAIRAVMGRYDSGLPQDALGDRLCAVFDVSSPTDLVVEASRHAGVPGWSTHARTVFDAAADGSSDAAAVVRSAAGELATLVQRLGMRGVPTEDVVLAGGVARNQPLLGDCVEQALKERHVHARVQTLSVAPVTGALVLAARDAGWRVQPPTPGHQRSHVRVG
jgi:N-acetylglucosamine kinase-like BadF-type ATPase